MMNPFRKLRNARESRKFNRLFDDCDVDLQHFVVVHHMQYAKPNAFTRTAEYRPYDDKDFQQTVDHAKELVGQLDLDPQSTDVLDMQPAFRSLYLEAELAESRALHKWQALNTRSDMLSEVQGGKVRLQALRSHLDDLVAEREALDKSDI